MFSFKRWNYSRVKKPRQMQLQSRQAEPWSGAVWCPSVWSWDPGDPATLDGISDLFHSTCVADCVWPHAAQTPSSADDEVRAVRRRPDFSSVHQLLPDHAPCTAWQQQHTQFICVLQSTSLHPTFSFSCMCQGLTWHPLSLRYGLTTTVFAAKLVNISDTGGCQAWNHFWSVVSVQSERHRRRSTYLQFFCSSSLLTNCLSDSHFSSLFFWHFTHRVWRQRIFNA